MFRDHVVNEVEKLRLISPDTGLPLTPKEIVDQVEFAAKLGYLEYMDLNRALLSSDTERVSREQLYLRFLVTALDKTN